MSYTNLIFFFEIWKQGDWFLFHLPTVKSVKTLLCMCD